MPGSHFLSHFTIAFLSRTTPSPSTVSPGSMLRLFCSPTPPLSRHLHVCSSQWTSTVQLKGHFPREVPRDPFSHPTFPELCDTFLHHFIIIFLLFICLPCWSRSRVSSRALTIAGCLANTCSMNQRINTGPKGELLMCSLE